MTDLIKISNTTVRVSGTPALLSVNFAELKIALENELQKYDVVVTVDTVPDAKKLATELNQTAGKIEGVRKAEVARVSEPITAFNDNMKSLVEMCKDGRTKLLEQIGKFEEETRETVRGLLEDMRDKLWESLGIEEVFREVSIDDLVILSNLTGKGNLTAKAKGAVESRVRLNKDLQDTVERRLLMLENASYRAGLSAPLTRDHVAMFLMRDEQTYNAELERVINAEIEREKTTREVMRKKLEEERRQAELPQEKELQQDSNVGSVTYEVPVEKAGQAVGVAMWDEGPAAPDEVRSEDPAPYLPEPKTDNGRRKVKVTATFLTTVSSNVSDEAIKAEMRRVIVEKAGLRTLWMVEVEEAQ